MCFLFILVLDSIFWLYKPFGFIYPINTLYNLRFNRTDWIFNCIRNFLDALLGPGPGHRPSNHTRRHCHDICYIIIAQVYFLVIRRRRCVFYGNVSAMGLKQFAEWFHQILILHGGAIRLFPTVFAPNGWIIIERINNICWICVDDTRGAFHLVFVYHQRIFDCQQFRPMVCYQAGGNGFAYGWVLRTREIQCITGRLYWRHIVITWPASVDFNWGSRD